VLIAAASLLAVLLAYPAAASTSAAATTASAAAAQIGPAPRALTSGHPLVAAIAPSTMAGSTWAQSTVADVPGNCKADRSAVSRSSSGDVKLSTTGAANNCTWIASPTAMPTTPGYIYEADVYYSNFKDWPGFWMVGNSWPSQGELDAAEPNFGVNYVTWHQAPCNTTRADTEISTNPWAYACKTTVKAAGKNIGPGWHVIDIAWTATGVQVYYDGALYITIRENVTAGQTADPMRVVFSQGSCQNGANNECVAGAKGTAGNVQVKYVRVFS
jgi:hypothetical protein